MLRSHSLRMRGFGRQLAELGKSEAVFLIPNRKFVKLGSPNSASSFVSGLNLEMKGGGKGKGEYANASGRKFNRAKKGQGIS